MNSFHITELGRALAEQHFGIIAYHLDEEACTSETAFASVDLLEQRRVRVKLSNSGYEVVPEDKLDHSHDPQIFETLDDLLSTTSPKYTDRRMEELRARLAELEDTL